MVWHGTFASAAHENNDEQCTYTVGVVISVKISDEELINLIQKQRLDEDETHKFMQHIVSAVDHLHKAGIILIVIHSKNKWITLI